MPLSAASHLSHGHRTRLRASPQDIKKHKWFRGLNWAALYNKQMPATRIPDPELLAAGAYYPKYPDSQEESGPLLEKSKQEVRVPARFGPRPLRVYARASLLSARHLTAAHLDRLTCMRFCPQLFDYWSKEDKSESGP